MKHVTFIKHAPVMRPRVAPSGDIEKMRLLLESAYRQLYRAGTIAALGGLECHEDIADALECVEGAMAWRNKARMPTSKLI